MAGNSFISSFKKLPKAAALAALIIFLVELGSAGLLHIFKSRRMGEGDLFIAEGVLSRMKFKGPATDIPYDKKYRFQHYDSVEEMGSRGPYDVIVFGSSVGETGWTEMLRIDYGLKICKSVLKPGPDHPLAYFIPLAACYPRINRERKAVWLWVDLTERSSRNFKDLGDLSKDIQDYQAAVFDSRRLLRTPATRLFRYLSYQLENIYNPLVKAIDIGPREELFYLPDLEGLDQEVDFNPGEYSKLTRDLKDYQESAAKNGCILAMAAFPTKPQQYEWLINKGADPQAISRRVNLKVLEKAAKDNNIPFLDLEAGLDSLARDIYQKEGRLLWNRADSHMNKIGNRYTAEIIKSFIEGIEKNYFKDGKQTE